MAAKKYIKNNAGILTEQGATVTSSGGGNDGDIVALDSTGRIDNSMMPVGVGADTALIIASEALSAGDYVNVWSSSGAFKIRKADASVSGKDAHGFVLASVSSAASGTVYFEGTNTQVSSQTPGVVYLSATTPGAGTATAPSGSGNVIQRIGYAVNATAVNFDASIPIVLA